MFDTNAYWLERGKTYVDEGLRLFTPYMESQAAFIVDTVRSFAPRQVLDLGCGFGRLTKRLSLAMPAATITGIDLSPDQIKNATKYCAGLSQIRFSCADILGPSHFLSYDVGVASELFLHLARPDLLKLIPKIMRACPVLVHDFDIDWKDTASPHVFNHDYMAIYSALGLDVEKRIKDEVGLMVVRRG